MDTDIKGWSVKSHCINCMASRSLAPELMMESDGQSVFHRQPQTNEEITAAWRAVQVCPVGAVKPPKDQPSPNSLFPEELGGEVYRLGHNTTKSYGAHSYFVNAGPTRLMVDGPAWSSGLVEWIEKRGGLDHILLTHKDDVGDTERYADRFGAEVWIHEADADSAPFASKIIGDRVPSAIPEIEVLPLPGHTRGSVGYLYAGETLFTGDTLAWDDHAKMLRGYRQFCWFDWSTQIDSIASLQGAGITTILAGHGGSITLTVEEMDREIENLVSREQS